MSAYGRNFEFRVPPVGGQRSGRYVTPSTGTPIPLGAPVAVDPTESPNELGLQPIVLASDEVPEPGRCGILVYEYGPAGFAGDDPWLTTFSDKDVAPLGKAVQVVSGDTVKVVLRNTSDRQFLNTRDYAGRTMVAGLGATPTVAVGDYLKPHTTPSDANGYWIETATAAEAWLVVTAVDSARGEVEARFLF